MDDDLDIRVDFNYLLAEGTTQIKFHWETLGTHFMRASGEEQAEFLQGFHREAQHLGFVASEHQYGFVADCIPGDATRGAVAAELRRLADALDGGG